MLHPHLYFWKRKPTPPIPHCDFFKYLLTKQQIQQMSHADEDNGLLFFYKFKNHLFDQNEDDQLIINRIRQQPLKVCGAIIYQLTNLYNQKLNDIVESIQDEKNNLAKKLIETQQQLQHSLEDNEFFKATIDRLQEEKKQTEDNLNQSIDFFERSRDEIVMKIHERQLIKSEQYKLYHDHQEIYTQNSQLQHTVQQYQKIVQILKQQILKINTIHQQLIQSNRIIEERYEQLINDQSNKIQQIQILNNKLYDKEQQIASMHEDYNKIRLFNQEDAYNHIYEQMYLKQNYNNQLLGLNFNNYEKSSNTSEKSMSKNSSIVNLQNDMDQKFQNVNATAEKNRPKIAFNSICETEQKKVKRIEGKHSSKQKIINSNYIKCSRKIQLNIPSSGQSKKKLVKTVSSKNFQEESAKLPSASEGNDSKMMEQLLKKKLNQKNIKITRLQSIIASLKQGVIEQSQKLTNIEGEYELQIQDIKDLLAYTKKQLAALYQKYANSCAQCEMYREKAESLEQQFTKTQQQHQTYCKQLKRQCKQYIIIRINEIQQEHNNLKMYWQKQIQALQQIKENTEKGQPNDLSQINEENQFNRQQYLLQFKESPASNNNCKIDSFSEIQSYVKLQNHYINGFDLELSSKLSYCDPYNEEIYVQQQFQIESDLGRFTERIINQRQPKTKEQQRGNFTDRCYVSCFKDDNLSISVSQKPFNLSFNTKVVQNCIKSTQDRSLMLWSNVNQYILSLNKVQMNETLEIHFNHLALQSQLYSFTQPISERKHQLQSQIVSISMIPQIKQLTLNSNQICMCYTAAIDKKIKLQSNLFKQTILPKLPILSLYSSLYSFNQKEKVVRPLSVQNSYKLNLQISKNRILQLIQKNIDLNEVFKRKQSFQMCSSPFLSIVKPQNIYKITSFEIFSKFSSEKMNQQIQASVETTVAQTQSSEKRQINDYSLQTEISEVAQQNYVQTDQLTIASTTMQTENITFCQYIQTESAKNTDQQMNTQDNFSKLNIQSKQLDMVIQIEKEEKSSESFSYEKSVLRLVRIPSFNLNFTNQKSRTSPFKQQLSAIPPSTTCSNSHQASHKKVISSSKNIYEEVEYQIGENNHKDIQELHEQEEEKCHNCLEFAQENLSTKNDQNIIQAQEKPQQHSVNCKQSVQQNLSPNYLNQEQNMDSLSISIMNKGFMYSKNSRQQGKTFNPESKSYRNQRLNQTEVDISPWLLDENKFTTIPQQIINILNPKSLHNLQKHLQKTKARLTIQQIIDKKPFQRPNSLKGKVFIFSCKNNQKVFLINSNIMIDLTSGGHILVQDNHRIDVNNFILGQSQVKITKTAQIIINRCDKKNKLPGTIPDGQWPIEYYITCKSHKRKSTGHQ